MKTLILGTVLLFCCAGAVAVAQFPPSPEQAKEALAYDSCLGRNGHSWNEAQMQRAEIDRGWHCQAARETDRLYQAAQTAQTPFWTRSTSTLHGGEILHGAMAAAGSVLDFWVECNYVGYPCLVDPPR